MNNLKWCRCAVLAAAIGAVAVPAFAADIGKIKVVRGQVGVERAGATHAASVGMRVQAADTIRTGDDGSVGITMDDDALLSAGPNTVLVLDRYAFDPTTSQGKFDSTLNKGSLAVISGRIAKQSPDAMTIRTPTAILGVRGTSFAVSAHE
ncbi:MAG: FecR domain-containing protein [Burkholderiales bacterium]|nr:FecR domain-containing protein [Burkholderiales bacterium]